jgi:hypothetical protein
VDRAKLYDPDYGENPREAFGEGQSERRAVPKNPSEKGRETVEYFHSSESDLLAYFRPSGP